MGLFDYFTSGRGQDAKDAAQKAADLFANIKAPTKEELTLPELEKYVNAGLMTPEQAQAYLQERDAFADQDIDQTGTAAQMAALNQLARVSEAGAEGTPEQQALLAKTESGFNRSVGGQRGAIAQEMRARGIPASIIEGALASVQSGQDAMTANQASLAGADQAYRAALDAMSGRAAAGANLQGQQNTQANTVAQAANAMQQFNAANQTGVSQSNAAARQQAGAANAATKQNTANLNTSTGNERTKYNTEVNQQVFDNSMRKAAGEAGALENVQNLAQEQGRQKAGLIGDSINVGADLLGKIGTGGAGVPTAAHGMIADLPNCDDGGVIPGQAEVMGDSEQNDVIPANLSPGEAVLPRTAVMRHMPEVLSMLSESRQEPDVSPEDLASVIMALKSIRMGASNV